jgi:hypothetical protein
MDSPTEREKLFNSHNSRIESVDLHDNADNYNCKIDIDQRNANINKMITQAVQTAHDTEIIGRSILLNLDDQRHKIIEIKRKTNNINGNITHSNGILHRMRNASARTKYISLLIIAILIFIIVIVIYLRAT